MTLTWTWITIAMTVAVLVLYDVMLMVMQRRRPQSVAPGHHATLREEWFETVSAQTGSEVLAVQTLRNSLMSATMLASTAALALMGTVTLAAPSLHQGLGTGQGISAVGPRLVLVLELVLLALLFAALVSSMMAVRFYNHAGFIGGMPVGSDARRRTCAGIRYVRRAGIYYPFRKNANRD